MPITAIDNGYGYTKKEPGGVLFPSAVGKGRLLTLKSTYSDLESLQLFYNDKHYFIGDLAKRESYDASFAFQDNKINHENTLVLILTAILIGVEDCISYIRTSVVTGLPVNHLSQKQEMMNLLNNKLFKVIWKEKERTIHIDKVLIFPQGAGALFNVIMDRYGKITKEQYFTKKIRLIDCGFKTTDYVTLDKLKYIDRESGTINIGLSHALSMLNAEIKNNKDLNGEIKNNGNLLLHEIENNDNYKEKLEQCRLAIAQKIVDELYDLVPNWDNCFAMYLAGGGAEYLKQKMNKWAIVVNNAQKANALGYVKIGQLKLNEGQKLASD